MKKQYKGFVTKLVAIALIVTAFGFQGINVQAASLTSLSDNMSRLSQNTLSNHDIRFVTPAGGGVASGETITLTFSSDFTPGSVVAGDMDLQEGNSNNCATAGWTDETLVASGASTSEFNASFTGNVLTFQSGGASATMAANICIRILIGTNASGGTNQIQNGALDDDDSITIAGTFGDTGIITVDIIADDQVVITATVDQSITFAISDNTIEFGTLSAGSAKYADDSAGDASEVEAHTLAAGTNATSGYVMYVSGATLTSGSNTITAIGGSNTASAAGTEQFGSRYTASGGAGVVTAPYADTGFAYDGASAPDQIASSTGPSATTTYSARYLANIAALTEAGAYSTTLTYTATATY